MTRKTFRKRKETRDEAIARADRAESSYYASFRALDLVMRGQMVEVPCRNRSGHRAWLGPELANGCRPVLLFEATAGRVHPDGSHDGIYHPYSDVLTFAGGYVHLYRLSQSQETDDMIAMIDAVKNRAFEERKLTPLAAEHMERVRSDGSDCE